MTAATFEMNAIGVENRAPIDLGGYRVHLRRQGVGAPAVVMEAAIWDIALTWALVQPEVAAFTHAVTYDRAGLGQSDASPRPRTGDVLVDELRALLHAAGVPAPYVLVGHSFSGLLVRLFAYHYPREVAGLVLIDPAHEDQDARFPAAIQTMAKSMFPAQLAAMRQLRDIVHTQGPEAAPLPARAAPNARRDRGTLSHPDSQQCDTP